MSEQNNTKNDSEELPTKKVNSDDFGMKKARPEDHNTYNPKGSSSDESLTRAYETPEFDLKK